MPEGSVEPLRIHVPDAALIDLQRRLASARWPEPETVDGWKQGVPLMYLRRLCQYWAQGYDWRATESRLNALPHFSTHIDGLNMHFVHVRSPRSDALPLIMTHGWPGSFLEFENVVGPLADPAAHGFPAAQAFHVVVPSLPGYGFSGKPTARGWGIHRIARAWVELMGRVGYQRFIAAGSDWGTSISTSLAMQHPERLLGIHLVPPLVPPDSDSTTITDDERSALADLDQRTRSGSGYSAVHATRPQTIGYSLLDSPVGLCAWIVEKIWSWSDHDSDLHRMLSRDLMHH